MPEMGMKKHYRRKRGVKMRKERLYIASVVMLALCIMLVSATAAPTSSPSSDSTSSSVSGSKSSGKCIPSDSKNCGQTKCIGQNLYQYLDGQWLLAQLNAPACGYVPPAVCKEGETKSVGSCTYQCLGNQWLLATCGVSPTPVAKEVLFNIWPEAPGDTSTDRGILSSAVTKDLGNLKTVTLYSGGVSGGAAFLNGGVPGAAYVGLCANLNIDACEDYQIGLPLNSEITIPNVRYIQLVNTIALTITDEPAYAHIVVSNVVYSTS
jgi:hypothetical protein